MVATVDLSTPGVGTPLAAIAAYLATSTKWAFDGAGQATALGATTTAPGLYAGLTGDTVARVSIGLDAADVPRIGFGPGGSTARDAFIRRTGVAALALGLADAPAPVAQSLSVQNVVAGTSNTAGVDFSIAGSQGTGTGAGGKILFKGAAAGSTGTSQNALATLLTIDPAGTVALASAASLSWSTDLFLFRDAANTLAQRNGTTAQTLRIYGTRTDASNYERAFISDNGAGTVTFGGQGLGTGAGVNVSISAPDPGGLINFQVGAATPWRINTSGHFINPTHNTYDIGTSISVGAPRNIFAAGIIQGLLRTAANAVTGLSAGVLAGATNASVVITDASGQAYRVPCII